VVDPVAVIGDELQAVARASEQFGVDLVGDGRDQHVGIAERRREIGLAHRRVVDVQPRVEQLAHARLDLIRQLARDDDKRLLFAGHSFLKLGSC